MITTLHPLISNLGTTFQKLKDKKQPPSWPGMKKNKMSWK